MPGAIITLILLSLAMGWAAFCKAGVSASGWSVTLIMAGAVSCGWWMLTRRIHRAPPLTRWLKAAVVLLPCYIGFQLIPLPVGVLEILSPGRADLVKALGPVVPGISSAPLSVIPPATFLGLLTFLCYTATFLLVRELAWHWIEKPWMLAVPVIAITAVEAALGLVQVLTGAGQATGTYLSHDHYAALLEMGLPFAFVYGFAILRRERKRFDSPALPAIKACAVWTVAAVLLLAISYSLCRAGLVVTACVLFFISALLISRRFGSRAWRWSWLAGIAAVIIFLLILASPDQLLTRFAQLPSTNRLSGDARMYIWKDTLPLIREFSWFGSGLGGFESTFMKYQTIRSNFLIGWAHNDYLQFLSELGIIGFGILAALISGILFQICRGIGRLRDQNRRLLLVACAGACLAILLHSVVDFNMYVPADGMTFAWIAGIGSLNGLD